MPDASADMQTTLTQLLPLFYEKAASAAMMKHGMNVLHLATEFLNSEQIPVMAFDEPLLLSSLSGVGPRHAWRRQIISNVMWPAHRNANVEHIW